MTDVADMELVEKIEFVKATVAPSDVADMLGLEVVGGKIPSPFNPDERTPSCHLYEDHWFDYGSGKGGDVIDLMIHLTGKPWGAVINLLAKGAVGNDLEPGRVQRAAKEPPRDLTEQYESMMVPYVDGCEKLFVLPGVDVARMTYGEIWALDFEGNVLIPHRSRIGVHGIKIRYRAGGKGAVPGSQFGHALYDPLGSYHSIGADVVLTEGESDCWALGQQLPSWVDVMALPSGAGLWRDTWLDQLAPYTRVWTAFDNDKAGKEATEKVRRAVGWGRWKELTVPTLYNDAREAISAGWRPGLYVHS